ncbi:hypothetical protein AVEN_161431-1 [Araneus ventricosus]|uniref:Uncharacterized protein n=1 Tax=Araneus ventricosus TaxID=182803 RepID=A0A4Y2LJ84_ARAVE|nr:hypothetical protein AVEN_161431-1 [Araneus ventricosus]
MQQAQYRRDLKWNRVSNLEPFNPDAETLTLGLVGPVRPCGYEHDNWETQRAGIPTGRPTCLYLHQTPRFQKACGDFLYPSSKVEFISPEKL